MDSTNCYIVLAQSHYISIFTSELEPTTIS